MHPWGISSRSISAPPAVTDVTAPVLSLPTATATGATTAIGTVSTDEGNGTLYYWFTENSSETAANIKANGESQSVTASGVQNVSVSGLTLGTTYYAHYVQDDDASNESNVVSSSAITTSSSVPYLDETEWWIDEKKKKPKHIDRQNAARRGGPFFEGDSFDDIDQDFDIL